MSTLKADTIVASDGSSPVTLIKQHAAKAWCNLDGTSATATSDLTGVRDSFNISAAVDNAVGDYTYVFVNAMSDVNYSFSAAVRGDSVSNDNIFNAHFSHAFSASQLIMRNRDAGAPRDSQQACIQTFGDLA